MKPLRKMTRRRGMTLMEVMIAVTLVALLSVGMLYSLRAGLGSVQTINRRVEADRRAGGAQRILEQQLAHLMPVFAPCGVDEFGRGGSLAAFFGGEQAVLRFVSAYSLEEAGRGHAKILELFTVPAPDGGGMRLVVNELPYSSSVSTGTLCGIRQDESLAGAPVLAFAPPQASPQSFVLADRLQRVTFAYQELLDVEPFERWLPHWVYPDRFPTAVRIDIVPLTSDASRTPPLPLYARIPITRKPNEAIQY